MGSGATLLDYLRLPQTLTWLFVHFTFYRCETKPSRGGNESTPTHQPIRTIDKQATSVKTSKQATGVKILSMRKCCPVLIKLTTLQHQRWSQRW